MDIAITLAFKIVSYVMIGFAMWKLIGEPFFKPWIEQSIRQSRKKKIQSLIAEGQQTQSKKSRLITHLEVVLKSISKDNKPMKPENFIALTVLIFSVTGVAVYTLVSDLLFTAAISIFFSAIPYLIIRYRLQAKRLATSLAFMNEFHKIVQLYQINNQDVYYLLLQLTDEIDDKHLRQTFMKMISNIQTDRSAERFNEEVHVFMYTINSISSNRFGKLLTKAYLDHTPIGNALLELNDEIKTRQQELQSQKTAMLQTVIVGYLPLPILIGATFAAYRGSSMYNFWEVFRTPWVSTLWLICLVATIFVTLSSYLLQKPRSDL